MVKSLKKLGLALFAILMISLLVVGCAMLANTGKVSQSENLDSNEDGLEIVGTNTVSSDNTITLSGTAAQMATGWQNAINYSLSKKVEVIVTLANNWTAPNSTAAGFGSGTGFVNGALNVPSGAKITLSLSGKKLNRNLASTTGIDNGYVISVSGTLTIRDVFAEYNKYTSIAIINSAIVGGITGGCNSGNSTGGGLIIGSTGIVNMYGGVIYNNKQTKDHSGGGVSNGGTFNMYGGMIAYNEAALGGSAIFSGGSAIIRIYAGIIRNNTSNSSTSSDLKGAVYTEYIDETHITYLGGGAQIYDNAQKDGTVCNLWLPAQQKISTLENFYQNGKGVACVGIRMKTPGIFCNDSLILDAGPSRFFKSDDVTYCVSGVAGAEIKLEQRAQTQKKATWQWTGTQSGSTTGSSAYVPTGTYTITLADGTIIYPASGASGKSITVSGNGIYSFRYNGGITNQVYNDMFQLVVGTVIYGDQNVGSVIPKPTGTIAAQTYTGSQLTAANPTGFNSTTMNISGNKQTNAGTYTVSVSPKSGYVWADGSISAVTFSWKINRKGIARPTGTIASQTYTGSELTAANPTGFSSSTMTISGNKKTNAGTYSVSVSPGSNYQWSSGTNVTSAITFSWTINRKGIARPTAGTNSLVYNTSSQTYQGSGYNSSTMVLGGTSSATNVGTYSITIAPNSNHKWNSGTATETITFPWSITPKPLTKPTLSTEPGFSTPTYNGQTITVPLNGYDTATMNITGNTGIDAGKKTAVITLKDTSNYKWADNTTGSVSLNWEIVKQEVTKPTQATQNVFVYDGNKKVYTPKGFDANKMILTDNEAIEANEYVAKVNLKPNYQWLGKTEEELTFKYTIVPPGLVVKEGVDYDFIYTDNGTWNQRYTYGDSYQHKMNDQELNQVAGENVFVLGKVLPNTTIAEFLNNVGNDKDFIKIYNNFGELVYDGTANEVASTIQYIGTSYKVELYVTGESGLEILDEVYISILGDLNADGIVNSADMAMMRRLLNGDINLYSLPLERVLAVYLDNKGGLTSVDQELLNGLVAGRITSNELFEEQELLGEDESYKYIDLVDGRRVQASTESAVIGNVTAGTSISEFVDKVAVFLSVGGASNITLYNNVGELVYNRTEGIQAGFNQDKEYVGTGWKVKASNSETQYTVSVLGDVTGDGIINAMDVTYLRRIANDNKLLAELEASGNKAVLLAATISNRGGICTADSEILWGTICGTMDLSKYN